MFHSNLIQYVNSGSFSKIDFFIGLFFMKYVFEKNSKRIIEPIDGENELGKNLSEELQIKVEPYSGSNHHVEKMMKSLLELEDDIAGAYLHGSLATLEEIAYSDFDALVILKDAVLKDKKRLAHVGLKLNQLQKVMREFDPLQHHGWFVLTESMLKSYPVTYFPSELFKNSVSLLQGKGLSFELYYDKRKIDFVSPFLKLSNGILQKLKNNYRPQNSFYLKSLLSEFMLLPSLYLQSKNSNAIYKKESFEIAKKDFSAEEWDIMDRVSEIRREWTYEISFIQKIILSSRNFTLRKIGRKFAPAMPYAIKDKLTDEFYSSMISLALAMQYKLKKSEVN